MWECFNRSDVPLKHPESIFLTEPYNCHRAYVIPGSSDRPSLSSFTCYVGSLKFRPPAVIAAFHTHI